MKEQYQLDFSRIEKAIGFIRAQFKSQPTLEEIAAHVHLSPFHFQKLFTEWAGVSPKKFLQYISIDHARKMLQDQHSLFDVAYETGLSGTSRLHDMFVTIEGMTPGEYKNGGEHISIKYSYADSPFGNIIIASTNKGICYIAFAEDETSAFNELRSTFPNALYLEMQDEMQRDALSFFTRDWHRPDKIKLHLKGTPFQIKVWETLLKIPSGQVCTYGNIAKQLELAGASRAVGSAVGGNLVAFLIPCHRVIQAGGGFGQYHWGSDRKVAMIGWEAAWSERE